VSRLRKNLIQSVFKNHRPTWACENSTRPCGYPIPGLFKSDFRIYLGTFGDFLPDFSRDSWRAAARVLERLLETFGGRLWHQFPTSLGRQLLKTITTRTKGVLLCCFLLSLIFSWHCIAPRGAKPLVGIRTTCEP